MSVLFIVCLLYLLLFSEGWFSWKEIHPIEKQMLATFFDGKSERRTPEIYLGIRNSIMRKFHFNPEVHLEKTDLSELSIGEMDARLEILEFLAHWGLVNFHPCPPVAQDCKLIESKSSADTAEEISLIEKLFQFETVHSYLVPVSKKAEIIAPVQFTSFLSQPKLAEDAITAAESSVEYHCNSCSVDCSRKRYHCRTQVSFTVPTEGFASLCAVLFIVLSKNVSEFILLSTEMLVVHCYELWRQENYIYEGAGQQGET